MGQSKEVKRPDVVLDVPMPWYDWIQKQIDLHPQYWPHLEGLYAKEKYGGLRVHYAILAVDDETWAALEEFENFLEEGCAQLCSICGATPTTMVRQNGWLYTACKNHVPPKESDTHGYEN